MIVVLLPQEFDPVATGEMLLVRLVALKLGQTDAPGCTDKDD